MQTSGIIGFNGAPSSCAAGASNKIDIGGHGWVQFWLPSGANGQLFGPDGGDLSMYRFPTCNTLYWANIVFQCNAGVWSLINQSTWYNIACQSTVYNQLQVAGVSFY